MRKIPTLFQRSEDRRHVIDVVTPGCEWVLDGGGVPTWKRDGTCILIRRDGLAVHAFARREVKPGNDRPPHFIELGTDDITGKTIGWEPADQSGFAKYLHEAIHVELLPGTYELCGPKVNGNPEGLATHQLFRHGAEVLTVAARTFAELAVLLPPMPIEGIVWHHPDGRMAKIKRRDFVRRATVE